MILSEIIWLILGVLLASAVHCAAWYVRIYSRKTAIRAGAICAGLYLFTFLRAPVSSCQLGFFLTMAFLELTAVLTLAALLGAVFARDLTISWWSGFLTVFLEVFLIKALILSVVALMNIFAKLLRIGWGLLDPVFYLFVYSLLGTAILLSALRPLSKSLFRRRLGGD